MTEEERIILEYNLKQLADMEEYKKANPFDPCCNYYTRGWRDGSDQIGDWIWSHHS